MNNVKDEYEVGYDEEQDVDAHIHSHRVNHIRNLEMSLSPEHDDEGKIQKRAKSEPNRAQNISRLALRILKRGLGMDSPRVAYYILKKKEEGHAARIAMRFLRKPLVTRSKDLNPVWPSLFLKILIAIPAASRFRNLALLIAILAAGPSSLFFRM